MADGKPEGLKRSFRVSGMTCATCSRTVEKALRKTEGVSFAAVNLATETAFVVLESALPQENLETAVRAVGYDVAYGNPEDLDRKRYEQSRRNLLIGWIVTGPLMVLMLAHMTGSHIMGFLWMEILGGAVVIFGAGRASIKGAWIALSHAHSNMDVLVVLGSVSAWATALMAAAGLHVVSFGALGSMIMALHLTGRAIESSLRDKAAKEIKGLLKLQAREALVLDESGLEVSVPIEAVKAGSTVLCRPGDRVPVDGEIAEGRSAVDESMVTGESIPVPKGLGDPVTGGSLNLTGPLKIRVTRVGEDTFLAKMIGLIQEAQGSKIPIQAFADRVTNAFVPSVAALAVLSGLFWGLSAGRFGGFLDKAGQILPWVTSVRDPLSLGVFAFITVIVIACPCALGLATPMALVAGTGQASRRGLVIRNAEAIQTASGVTVVVMDKTGTITEGHPAVAEHDLDEETLALAASLERRSNHPLAKAVAAFAEPGTPEPDSVEETAGEGVHGNFGEVELFVGRPLDPERYRSQLDLGRTVVEVRKNGTVTGFFAIQDPLREDAVEAVARLRDGGIRPVMATGDNVRTAKAVAAAVGIEEIHAGVRPEDKLSLIRDLQALGGKVLMVGDGMNDAAALKGADVGVAVGSGMDLAIDNADIVIVKGGVSRIADAVSISRMTLSVIRQNLFWAFAYNLLAIPLAMAALLHPIIAETAMAFSSISVILNSMRIRGASGSPDQR
jgi:Cu+-exporting ATPase